MKIVLQTLDGQLGGVRSKSSNVDCTIAPTLLLHRVSCNDGYYR